jgi:hypothetical protein
MIVELLFLEVNGDNLETINFLKSFSGWIVEDIFEQITITKGLEFNSPIRNYTTFLEHPFPTYYIKIINFPTLISIPIS